VSQVDEQVFLAADQLAAARCRTGVWLSARDPGAVRTEGISMGRSGYTWLGAVRSSRADRLVTAMVSAAARAMTVR
jgi:hypothetical protein